ncbi:MAG: acetyl xylan esterase [Planctomycetaceae bacterium]|nr:acetyl xylan esterase [Planctomycetaceae bacterium]
MFRILLAIVVLGSTHLVSNAAEGKHLFILSGQSNMAGLKPEESFTPTVEKMFGKENVIVVKHAVGGQPIRRWYKAWKDAEGTAPQKTGDLYDATMKKVNAAIKDQNLASVTFLWMQGERDANEQHGTVYEASLKGLYQQLSEDLGRDDINFVIGRLSDFDLKNQRYPHWSMVREAQVKVAEEMACGAWVDTDDLNDGKNRRGKEVRNDLHYSAKGYVVFGERLADAAIALIEKKS